MQNYNFSAIQTNVFFFCLMFTSLRLQVNVGSARLTRCLVDSLSSCLAKRSEAIKKPPLKYYTQEKVFSTELSQKLIAHCSKPTQQSEALLKVERLKTNVISRMSLLSHGFCRLSGEAHRNLPFVLCPLSAKR